MINKKFDRKLNAILSKSTNNLGKKPDIIQNQEKPDT